MIGGFGIDERLREWQDDEPRAEPFAQAVAFGTDDPATPLSENPWYAWPKRVFDVGFATIALVLSAPICLAVAALIRLTSPGPVIYRQPRVGRGGRGFTCYKFRTMVDGAHHARGHLLDLNEMAGPVFKIRDDPRLTSIGGYLRQYSVDEIPQFVNVLLGEMSVVGPRPPLPEEVVRYCPGDRRRLAVMPGLTCLWQIKGRGEIGFEEWMALDLEYIRRRSLWFDLTIVARTVPAVLSGRGAA